MKILMLGYFADNQTGIYIMNNLKEYASDVAAVDIRRIVQEIGSGESQDIILEEIDDLKINPDIILVLKGLELAPDTIEKLKQKFPKAKIVNWMFDKFIGGIPVWENEKYKEVIKLYDMFFCSLKGVADRLKNIGFDNVYWMPEAADENFHGRTYMNHYQKQKYGDDVAFIGTLGLVKLHPNRLPILNKIGKEGFRLKIWGNVIGEWKNIPRDVRRFHMQETAINIGHSKVVQSTLINLSIDQDPELELGQSARLYRIMCAGGFVLSTATKGLEKMFKINESKTAPITEDLDFVVFYDLDDLVDKLDYLLEQNDLREKIAENGRKKVLEKHTFKTRCKELLEVIKGETKEYLIPESEKRT